MSPNQVIVNQSFQKLDKTVKILRKEALSGLFETLLLIVNNWRHFSFAQSLYIKI